MIPLVQFWMIVVLAANGIPPEIENNPKWIGDGIVTSDDPEWILGLLWRPGVERGIGAYFQVFHCQDCGLVYATHVN
jgi:hypothetical protein